jgi:RimJ/RimL family protein N-acetyltransferase
MRSPNKCATSTFLVWLAQTKPLVGLLIARVNLVSALWNQSRNKSKPFETVPTTRGHLAFRVRLRPRTPLWLPSGSWRFSQEATPHDPTPNREKLEKAAGNGQYLFWTVNSEPVSIAGIVRRTKHGAAIADVYTPPGLRGRGYAGSVTAALVERIYAEGKLFVCLYTDLRNSFSNRCYAKVGFTPVCSSWHYVGAKRDTS